MQNYSVRDPSRFLAPLNNLTFVIASLDSLLFFKILKSARIHPSTHSICRIPFHAFFSRQRTDR
jgi:hypothetical protein